MKLKRLTKNKMLAALAVLLVVAAVAAGAWLVYRFVRRDAFANSTLKDGHVRLKCAKIKTPWGVAFTDDGRHVIVGGNSFLEIYSVAPAASGYGQALTLVRTAGVTMGHKFCEIHGITISNDGTMMAAGTGLGVLLFDMKKLLAGEPFQLGELLLPGEPDVTRGMKMPGAHELVFSTDDKFIVCPVEYRFKTMVIDVAKLRNPATAGDSVVKYLPSGSGTVGIALDKARNSVIWTSQYEAKRKPLRRVNGRDCNGTIRVADLGTMELTNTHTVGCEAARVALDGTTAYVTLRHEHSLLKIDTVTGQKTRKNDGNVGPAPVGVSVAMKGAYLVVAGSNRFADPPANGVIHLVDSKSLKTVKTLKALLFPRVIAVSPDGDNAVVGNHDSGVLSILHLPTLLKSGV